VEETRQNQGENEGNIVTERPEDSLEHVLDAWAAEPSTRQRYDRVRLERRDGESIILLVDAETARDLGDKLTIVAARARSRSRGAAGVPVDVAADPGAAEDMARARKVFALMGLDFVDDVDSRQLLLLPLVDEFRASRLDVEKAHAMLDEQRAKHVRDLAAIAERHVDAARELDAANVALDALRAELQSVKTDRSNLIAEAAERDIEREGEADPKIVAVTNGTITFAEDGDVSWSDFKRVAKAMKKRGLSPTNGEVLAEARRLQTADVRSDIDLTDPSDTVL
jgi:hypothetical protein